MKTEFLLQLIKKKGAQLLLKGFICLSLIVILPGCVFTGEKEAYRAAPYHAVTTQIPPKGVQRINVHQLKDRLLRDDVVLIDVFGALFREESLYFDGDWLVADARKNIPGSVWLPNVGKHSLSLVIERYFNMELQRLTDNDKNKGIVFYCIEDCWMSWNASKRALSWGYKNVMWFREGVDGWLDEGGRLQESKPIKLPVDD